MKSAIPVSFLELYRKNNQSIITLLISRTRNKTLPLIMISSSLNRSIMARTLFDAIQIKDVKALVLSSSEDLICKNLFCEKVTQPCICRIERTLEKINSSSLETIDLSNNKLESLPPSLAKMKNLKVLNLNDNQLKQIPSEIISNLVSLEELHVKNNPLIEIPANLKATTKILV